MENNMNNPNSFNQQNNPGGQNPQGQYPQQNYPNGQYPQNQFNMTAGQNPQNQFNMQGSQYPQQGYPGNYPPQPMQGNNQYYQNPEAQKGSKRIFMAAMIVSAIAFFAVASIFIIKFVNKNVNKDDGKGKVKTYTIEDIKEQYGYLDVNVREQETDGIKFSICYPTKYSSDRDYYVIYLFDNNNDAKEYFGYMRNTYFGSITFEEENHIEGWIAGICDADQKDSIELIGNYIAIKELDFIGYEW